MNRKTLTVLIFFCLFIGCNIFAAEYWATGASGLWYSPDGVVLTAWGQLDSPGYTDVAYIAHGATVTYDGTLTTEPGARVSTTYIGSWSDYSNGALPDQDTLNIVNGGTLHQDAWAFIGAADGDFGVINIDATSAWNSSSVVNVGYNGHGEVNVYGNLVADFNNGSGGLFIDNKWSGADTGSGVINVYPGGTVSNWLELGPNGLIDIKGGAVRLAGSYWGTSWTDYLTPYIGTQVIGFGGSGTVNISVEGDYTVLTATVEAKAHSPVPSDGATWVQVDSSLNWQTGVDAPSTITKHVLYLGTDKTAVGNALPADAEIYKGEFDVSVNQFSLAGKGIEKSKTYYWRVDEKIDAATIITGDVWSFSTESVYPVSELPDWAKPGYSVWQGNNSVYDITDRTKWSVSINSGSMTIQSMPGLIVNVQPTGSTEAFPYLARTSFAVSDWRNYKRLTGRMRILYADSREHTRNLAFVFLDHNTRHANRDNRPLVQQIRYLKVAGEEWVDFSFDLDKEAVSRSNMYGLLIHAYSNPPSNPNQFTMEIENIQLEGSDPEAMVFDAKEYPKHRFDPADDYVYPVFEAVSSATAGALTTDDSLSVEIGSAGDIRKISLAGQTLGVSSGASGATGVLVQDAYTNNAPVMIGGTITAEDGKIMQSSSIGDMQLNVDVEYRTNDDGYLEVAGTVSDLRGMDRMLTMYVALPVQDGPWKWGESIIKQQDVSSLMGTFPQIEAITNKCPISSISLEGIGGLSLAVMMDQPRQFRIGYNPKYDIYYAAFDLGLVSTVNTKGKSLASADFKVVLYSHDPAWGLRSAVDRYYEFFPEFFVKRTLVDGGWGIWRSDPNPPADYLDDGFRYSWGGNPVVYKWNNDHGVVNLEYQEVEYNQQSMGDMTSASNVEVLDRLNALAAGDQQTMDAFKVLAYPTVGGGAQINADGRTLWGKTLEESIQMISDATVRSGIYDVNGNLDFSVGYRPWIGDSDLGAMFACNMDPDIPNGKGWFASDVSYKYEIQAAENNTGAVVDGLAMDSFLQAGFNFREEHFQYSDIPLTFSTVNNLKLTGRPGPVPVIGKVFSTIEWLKDVRSGFLSDKIVTGNVNIGEADAGRLTFASPFIDVFGWESHSVPQPEFFRVLARDKIISDLPYSYAPPWQTRFNLLYCTFPGQGHDREVMKECYGQLTEMSAVGWQPVTNAVCDNSSIRIERYGSGEKIYLAMHNSSTNASDTFNVTLDLDALHLSNCTGKDLLSSAPFTVSNGVFQRSLAGLDTIVVVIEGDDLIAPTPDPMDWKVAPHSTGKALITMTATAADDPSGVEYYFECINNASHDSGWQQSAVYDDDDLSAGIEYTYRVKSRDKSIAGNETGFSSSRSAATFDVCDFNEDGDVDLIDFAEFAGEWLSTQVDVASTNFGFEDDIVNDGESLLSLPTGWSSGWGDTYVLNPSDVQWQARYASGQTVSEGENICWFGSFAAGLRQILAHEILADAEYAFSVDVGAYYDPGNSWMLIRLLAIAEDDTESIIKEFYVYENTPPSGDGEQLVEGNWVQEATTWDSSSRPELAGQKLMVHLSGNLIDVDDVKLTVNCGMAADFNNDCAVDVGDLLIFATHWAGNN